MKSVEEGEEELSVAGSSSGIASSQCKREFLPSPAEAIWRPVSLDITGRVV